jgi:hypothetical protein
VECEVFENETYGPLKGWGGATLGATILGTRLKYSNRKGELSSDLFPEVPPPPPHARTHASLLTATIPCASK